MSGRIKQSVSARLESGEITESQAYELTREAALSSLDRAMQCRHVLESKLIQRGFPVDQVGSVLDRLEAVGLVDDAEYAEAVVRARAVRGFAKRAIGAELARKGVAATTSAQALAQIDSAQQMEAAQQVAAKAVQRCVGLAPEVKARRAYGAVSRRGFSASIATAAVAQALAMSSEAIGADGLAANAEAA